MGRERRDRDGRLPELDLSLGDARDVEEVIHEPRHVAHLALDDLVLGSRGSARAQEREGGRDRGERVAELVRQHREELVLRARRRLELAHEHGALGRRALDVASCDHLRRHLDRDHHHRLDRARRRADRDHVEVDVAVLDAPVLEARERDVLLACLVAITEAVHAIQDGLDLGSPQLREALVPRLPTTRLPTSCSYSSFASVKSHWGPTSKAAANGA